MGDKYIDEFDNIDGSLSNSDLFLMYGNCDTVNASLGAIANYINNLIPDISITGGTYNPVNGVATFTNNSGGTFNVSGFLTGYTDTTISAFTYDNANTFKIDSTNGDSFSTNVISFTGLTINGNLNVTGTTNLGSINVNTISATTYQNLPLDVYVTGGTYTSGEITLNRNDGNLISISGLPIGGGGGQAYFLNISNNQSPYKEFSPFATLGPEQSVMISVNGNTTSTIESFLTPVGYPNTPLIPGGVWGFYLHTYKESQSSNFEVYCDVYKWSTGGTETYLFSTDPVNLLGVDPNALMIITDGFYSGSTINVNDRILVKVKASNLDSSTKNITLLSEDNVHYSYCVTTFSTVGTLTCDNLSGCSVIQLIESDLTKKLNKSGGTMTGTLYVPTISATTYQNLPLDKYVTGGTYSNGTATFRNNYNSTFTVSGFKTSDIFVTGGTYSNGTATFKNNNGGTFNVNGFIASAYSTVQDEGVSLTQQSVINFVGAGVVVSNGVGKTIVTVPSIANLSDWTQSTSYASGSYVVALYENEYRLWRAMSSFTSGTGSFPAGNTIATDLNGYVGQWQEVSPLRGSMSNMTFTGSMTYGGSLTPPVLVGPNNTTFSNYSPAGLSTTNFLRISSTNNVNIDGLLAPSPVKNQGLYICNVGTGTITIKDATGSSSTLTNRFLLGGDKNLQANEGIMLIYDDISLRWRSQAIQI